MKVMYRGHEITVTKEKCLGGWMLMYYSIFRDGKECVTNFSEDSSTVREYVGYMKERVDNELASDNPWGFE